MEVGTRRSAGEPGREGRFRAWWVGLLLVLRLAYLGQYLKLPFVFGPLFDSQVYLAQAWAVRSGRFGDAALLAFSPLYGYFLALLGPEAGDLLPILVQLALGVGNALLVARITTHCFGARAAVWSALAFTLYGPLLLFETKLMSETLGISLLLLAVERFASPAFAVGRPAAIVASGSALALAVLARASLLFSLPFFVLFALLRGPASTQGSRARLAAPTYGGEPLLGMRRSIGLALVILGLLGAYGSFTRWQSGIFVPVILVSNTVVETTRGEWSGDLSSLQQKGAPPVGAFSVVEQAQKRLAALRLGRPDPASQRPPLAGVSVLGWLRQLPSKLWLTLRDVETSFDYGFYGERSEVPVLYLTFATFGMLSCMAALGAWLALRRGLLRGLVPLAPIILGILVTTTLFHPSTRYRLPLVVAFAPLVGLAWIEALEAYRSGRRKWLFALVLLTLGFAVRGATRPLANPAAWQLRVAESAAMANDLPECRARLRAALRLASGSEGAGARAAYVATLLPGCIVR